MMQDATTSIVARDEAGHGGMDHGTVTVPEMVYMLVLDEGSGMIHPRAEIVLNTTLKYATLHELALRGHVVLGPGQVTISDRKMTNHPLLDDMMHFLKQGGLPLFFTGVRETLAKGMIARGIIHRKPGLPGKNFCTRPALRARLVASVRDAVMGNARPDPRLVSVACLMKRAGLLHVVFSRSELPVARARVKLLELTVLARGLARPVLATTPHDEPRPRPARDPVIEAPERPTREPVLPRDLVEMPALGSHRVEELWHLATGAADSGNVDAFARLVTAALDAAIDQRHFLRTGKTAADVNEKARALLDARIIPIAGEDLAWLVETRRAHARAEMSFQERDVLRLASIAKAVIVACIGVEEAPLAP